MILDTWQNPALDCRAKRPVFAYPSPTIPTGAPLEEILAISAAYRATLATQPAIKEPANDTPKLA